MSATNPNIIVNIAVDTAYVYSQSTGQYGLDAGIYMMDNNVSSGSAQEGTLELVTQTVQAGEWVGFNVFPIDQLWQNGDTVSIAGFEVSNGVNIWGAQGYWQKGKAPYQWVAQCTKSGNMIYQVKILVSPGNGAPAQAYWWDPFMNAQS